MTLFLSPFNRLDLASSPAWVCCTDQGITISFTLILKHQPSDPSSKSFQQELFSKPSWGHCSACHGKRKFSSGRISPEKKGGGNRVQGSLKALQRSSEQTWSEFWVCSKTLKDFLDCVTAAEYCYLCRRLWPVLVLSLFMFSFVSSALETSPSGFFNYCWHNLEVRLRL